MTYYKLNSILSSISPNKKSAIRKLKGRINRKINKYPRDIHFYKRNKNTGSQNKKNAYSFIYMELRILENTLKSL